MGATLPNLHHDLATITEIRNALYAGKEVITHTDAVSVPGWSGAGYLILDPMTGDGAYKIGGGENGSFLEWLQDTLEKIISILSIIEKIVKKAGSILKPIISILKQLKKMAAIGVVLIDILKKCNPGWALLGISLYLLQVVVTSVVIGALTAGLTSISAGCGNLAPACLYGASFIIAGALEVAANLLKDTAETISTGCETLPGS